MADLPTWDDFRCAALARGCNEAVVRDWTPLEVVPEHSHPFKAEALVVAGEMWLTQNGQVAHVVVGDTFTLAAHELHDERYGPAGATYWVARTALDAE